MSDTPNIDIRPDHWQIVRDILRKHVPQYEVWAFGSRAKWLAKQYSDLDLTIITDQPLSLAVSAALADDFSESDLPWKVDVVDWATTGESFRKIIERDKVVVQESQHKSSSAASAWHEVPLSELTATPATYGIVQPGQVASDGVPMVRVNNFKGHSLSLEDVMRVAPEIEGKYERTRIQAGDVLITIVGSVGQIVIAPESLAGWNIARAVALIRPKVPELSRWISMVLRSPYAQHQLGVAANTTVQTTINLKDLRQLKIPLPGKRERHAITGILGALDDKIELNRRMNQTLEAMARALFKSWFVDFDGVPPEDMQESELGLIPKGWRAASLDSVAHYLNGLALQKFPPESEVDFLPVIKIAQLRAGNTQNADKASTRIKSEHIVEDGDVLFSWSGTLEVEVWTGGRGALNQHLFKVTSTEVPKWFYYFATREHLPDFRTIAAGKATTMGHIQRKHLADAKVAVPPADAMGEFDRTIAPLFEQIINNALQSRTLAQLRDILLPKLISGEFGVRDVKCFMEKAR
ncbi:restriction endonuclease subunit S [Xanthomonas campestris pv. badrii]|uniref:Restriction endonuclease subunit S n=1 Tax=Xanthomonas campestris pv. badrii TaxID=149696 RepID=A0A7Z2ZGB7_XANCA|nr:restriction endonuclease subunit S [Xanthomonas campestris]MCC4602421.1 restriction endonuclease subunit S [Xanthomonas campestris pv. parthenii]QJD67006.1 restriction endonuclease subunit S [Xanthomonas campestris pv. badrii]